MSCSPRADYSSLVPLFCVGLLGLPHILDSELGLFETCWVQLPYLASMALLDWCGHCYPSLPGSYARICGSALLDSLLTDTTSGIAFPG